MHMVMRLVTKETYGPVVVQPGKGLKFKYEPILDATFLVLFY